MKKILFVVFLFIFVPKILLAYETDMLNLKTPTGLEKGKGEFKIQHRFKGKVSEEPIDTFLGMDRGVAVGIGFRYVVWSKLELNALRIWDGKEYTAGVSYTYSLPQVPVDSRIDIQFFSYEEFNLEEEAFERKNNLFGLLSLQGEPILKRIKPVVDVGYDGEENNFGAGLGISVLVLEKKGLLQKIRVLGEYFPTAYDDQKRCFTFGVRLQTFGHNFDFIFGNNSEIGMRRLMSGTGTEDGIYFGFNIKRRL